VDNTDRVHDLGDFDGLRLPTLPRSWNGARWWERGGGSAVLRMEQGYRDYGHDIDNTDTVLEAGLGFAVALDKRHLRVC
jgi:hypothetical protein